MLTNATLIAGPTASGKSAFAIKIAQQKNGVIINADSMQVYDVLQVLTARPDKKDLDQAPHFLYGHRAPAEPYSTGHWLQDVSRTIPEIAPDRHIIFVGGTGLYFRALLGGLSPMPEIDDLVRQRWREQLQQLGSRELHRILQARDPEAAQALNTSDGQRIARALEVLDASGKSILYWQSQPGAPLLDADSVEALVMEPDRSQLHGRIDERFDQMIELGAIDEVESLRALELPDTMSAMKAIGVKQLGAYLDGFLPLEDAIERSKAATRQYAKRQMTWFRNQFGDNWRRMKT